MSPSNTQIKAELRSTTDEALRNYTGRIKQVIAKEPRWMVQRRKRNAKINAAD